MKKNELIYRDDDICIIGMSCEFPKSKNINEYEKNLFANVDCLTRNKEYDTNNFVGAYGKMENPYMFDNDFFGITPYDAIKMDPQQRKLFEHVYAALDTAGYGDRKNDNGVTGLFSAAHSTHYIWKDCYQNDTYDGEKISMLGLFAGSAISTRISYSLNLTGPIVTFDDACASSLVGIDLACNVLRRNECEKCVVAAASVCEEQDGYYIAENADSLDGYVRSYDQNGTGFVPSSAAAAVVLKKYKDAVRDNDPILAVIKGSFVTCDGNRKIGYAAPGVLGEYEAICNATECAGVTVNDINYIEGHGTATPIGDSVEISAIKKFLKKKTNGKCGLGSVKSQIGHTDCVSGLAGLIKVILSMHKGEIPASIHCDTVNEDIKEKSKVFIVRKNLPLNQGEGLIMGINSFGMGGINSNIVVQEPPAKVTKSEFSSEYDIIIPFSGKSKFSAEKTAEDFLEYAEERKLSLVDAAGVYINKRQSREYRTYVRLSSDGSSEKKVKAIKSFPENNRKIIFMFPGGSSQMENMGKEMYMRNSTFKSHIDTYLDILNKNENIDLRPHFTGEHMEMNIVNGLCLIFIISCSFAELLIDAGVKPDYLLGNSLGEYGAACISGVLSKEDALKMVVLRGNLISRTEDGSMLSICADRKQTEELIAGTSAEISAVNCQNRISVSGSPEILKQIEEKAKEKGIVTVYLNVGKAGHCAHTEPIMDEFYEGIKNIHFNTGNIDIISSRLGRVAARDEMSNAEFWKNHLRYSVEFYDAAESIAENQNLIFIECGTGTQLASFVRRIYTDRCDKHVISMVEESVFPEYRQYSSAIGRIWQSGIDINRNITDDIDYSETANIYVPSYHFDGKEFKHKLSGKNIKNVNTAIYDGLTDKHLLLTEYILDNSEGRNVLVESDKEKYLSAWNTEDILSVNNKYNDESLVEKYFKDESTVILNNIPEYVADANNISAACILKFFENFDADFKNKIWTEEKVIIDFKIIDEYIPFLKYLIEFLKDYNYINYEYGMFKFNDKSASVKPKYELLEIYKNKYPDTYSYMEFCCFISDTWNETFTGKKIGNEILYPNGSLELIEKFSRNMPDITYQTSCIKVLGDYLSELKSKLDRKIRILEIGGGTGELTNIILEKIGIDGIEYTFTDVGKTFIEARKTSDGENDFMKYGILDVSKDPIRQGYRENYYDIVLGLNVVQASCNIRDSFYNINRLLTGGGIFGMVETCERLELINMIFGYVPGWWNYSDDPIRSRSTVSTEKLKEFIEKSEFKNVLTLPKHRTSDTYLFTAVKENSEDRTFCSDEKEGNYRKIKENYFNNIYVFEENCDDAKAIENKYSCTNSIGFLKNNESDCSDKYDTNDPEEIKIYDIIYEILGMDRIEKRDRLVDIGFDSISGLIFISNIKNVLKKELDISDLYKCETIEMLLNKLKSVKRNDELIIDQVEKVQKPTANIDNLLDDLNL